MTILSADAPTPGDLTPNIWMSLIWILLMFAFQIVGLILAVLLNVALGFETDIWSPTNANPVTLMLGVLIGNSMLIAIRAKYLAAHFKRIQHLWHIGISTGAVLAMLAINWIYEVLLIGKSVQPSNELIVDAIRTSPAGALYVFFAVAISAPILEEILFRGQLQSALKGLAIKRELQEPGKIAMVIAAALFAAIHLQPLAFPILFTSGLAMGWIREKTGSITLPILIHMVMNTVGVLAMLFAG